MKFIVFAVLLLLSSGAALGENLTNSAGEWYFWSDNTRIYARSVGAEGKPPIIVIHGGFGAGHSYLLPALEPLFKNRRFVFFDQRGSLRSPAESDSISIDSFVKDLEQLRKELGLKKITILSHSMGSVTAYAYLSKYPQNVEKIIFASPVFPFFPGITPDKEMLQQIGLSVEQDSPAVKELIADLTSQKTGFERKYKEQLKLEGLDGEPKNAQERNAQWLISFASTNIYDISKWRQMRGGQAFYNAQVYPDIVRNSGGDDAYRESWKSYFPFLANNSSKLIFIIGHDDFIDSSYKYWPLIFKQLANASVTLIHRAGHNIWIDQPKAFTEAVRHALKERHNNSFKPKPLRGSA